MKTIVTFLGTKPTLTRYSYNGKVFEGEVFAKALLQFLEFDRMLVFSTPEAHEKTWPVLEVLGDERIHEIPISISARREDIWALFDVVIDQVGEGETVVFDITHGLRSIPFLAFLFAAYLKTAKQVNIEAIFYGAFELGDASKGIPAPVIDLSEYVTMLDWIVATDQFVNTGNARRLSDLLARPGKEHKASNAAANQLRKVSQAAFLVQPFTLMREADQLGAALDQAVEDFSVTARPFKVLSEKIVSSYVPLSAGDWASEKEKLVAQFMMIEWYRQRGQLIQALTLAREWLVDAVTVRLGLPVDYRRTPRGTMDRAVTGLGKVGGKIRDEETDEFRDFTPSDLNEYGRKIYNDWPEKTTIGSLANTLSEVRNQLNHAEHQANPFKLDTIQKKAEKALETLADLAQSWGFSAISQTKSDTQS